MIKKFRKQPRSRIVKKGDTYPEISQPYLRIVDQTNVDVKRILIGQKNVIDPDSDIFWVDQLAYKNDITYLMFSSQLYMGVFDNYGNALPVIAVSNNNTYHISDGSLEVETTDAPSQFAFHNDQSYDIEVTLYRDGMAMARTTVAAGDTFHFRYQPTIWVYATDTLTGSISWSDVNTQISLLGIQSADVILTLSNGIYNWTLSNIVT